MLVRQRQRVGATIALGALAGTLVGLIGTSWVGRPPRDRSLPVRPSARSPFETALREAGRLRGMAVQQVAGGLEAAAEWDPQAGDVGDQSSRRAWEAQMAQDRGGYLRRAVTEAERAIALASTPEEEYRTTARLALLQCNLGHHDAELRLALRLVDLQPRNELSYLWLRRAARCTGQRRLEEWANGQLETLRMTAARQSAPRPSSDP